MRMTPLQTEHADPFKVVKPFTAAERAPLFCAIGKLETDGVAPVSRLPFSIKVLLESALRHCDERVVTREDVRNIAGWRPAQPGDREIPFQPARVIMQDFTGVPALVDLAALRDALTALGGDPARLNPVIPVDLVIDHSVQVDHFATADALAQNTAIEIDRNAERYRFLKWARQAVGNLRVVPPGMGIVHQVNLEFLAQGVVERDGWVFPDSLVGTDSHTPMINGLGVVGWGVGGIEAESVMLGEPIRMLPPPVVGVRLDGRLRPGTTATDLVLTLTERLRRHGVVGKFVEFYGPGLRFLSVADRATVANMTPEFGATLGLFPVDEATLAYLELTGRSAEVRQRVRTLLQAQGLFHDPALPEPLYSETVPIDLDAVVPCVAGPRRPQDRVSLGELKSVCPASAPARTDDATSGAVEGAPDGLRDHAVVIAAITSCTNTSNPDVMIGAGLLARNAVRRGLRVPAHVKTSLAPGSQVVTRYLAAAGLDKPLETLGFHTVAYGCTTCIGNSGPLPEPVADAIRLRKLKVHAVLSGNRNFEGRIHPLVHGSFLASPLLVVAFALAGRMDIDLTREPLGRDEQGRPVRLADLWPSPAEIADVSRTVVSPAAFQATYARIFEGESEWDRLKTAQGTVFAWDAESTYIRRPPFLEGVGRSATCLTPIENAQALLLLGDMVTTDHISPAGAIAPDSPAARYLLAQGVAPGDWNSYGARRGNHEVMLRGTFANPRLQNALAPERGGWTRLSPGSEPLPVYDAACALAAESRPAIVLAGKDYGAGSSRDWAAKGTRMLGICAVVAESFERIHRANLVGMGVLPLAFAPGDGWRALGLDGSERFALEAELDLLTPGMEMDLCATKPDGRQLRFRVRCRIDTPAELEVFRHGGILPATLRRLAGESV